MRLSKRTEYGVMATARLADRARSGPGYLQSREIAENEKLPGKFLESILLALKSAGILESKVGAGGGYRLIRDAEELTVGEVVSILETSSAKAEDEDAPTDTVGRRTLNLINGRIEQAFESKVGSMTFAQVLDQLDSGTPARPNASANSVAAAKPAAPQATPGAPAAPRPIPSFSNQHTR